MDEFKAAPAQETPSPLSPPRRLEFLRLITWYIYALRLLRLHWSRFALLFFGWFVLAEMMTTFPYIGFWAKIAFATISVQGLLWAFHAAASERQPMFDMVLKGFTLPPQIQGFLVGQIFVAFGLGITYVGWADGEGAARWLALRDFTDGTPPRLHSLLVLKLIAALVTCWFGFVGLLGFFGITDLRLAVAISVRATVLNLPALLVISLLDLLLDLLQDAMPRTLPFVLLGLFLTVVVLAISVGASYASFRDIFRPAESSPPEP